VKAPTWIMIVRAVLVLPKTLDADLLASCGLSLAEYTVLMHLSEAPGRSMRMNELARESILSASGVTRLVERMERQGLVVRAQAAGDGRGMTATVTGADLDLAAFATAVGSFGPAAEGAAAGPASRTRGRARS
jgi:DNA-binding MarR family transcriptional regulator